MHLLDDRVEQAYAHSVEGDLARDPEREAALQAAHALGAEVLPHAVEPAPVHPRLSSEASLVVELQPHLGELEWMGEAHGDAARERRHAHLLQQAHLRRFRHSAGRKQRDRRPRTRALSSRSVMQGARTAGKVRPGSDTGARTVGCSLRAH